MPPPNICFKRSLGLREKAKYQDERREHHGDGGAGWQGGRERTLSQGGPSFTKLVTTKTVLSRPLGEQRLWLWQSLSPACRKQHCSCRVPASVLLPSSSIIEKQNILS